MLHTYIHTYIHYITYFVRQSLQKFTEKVTLELPFGEICKLGQYTFLWFVVIMQGKYK